VSRKLDRLQAIKEVVSYAQIDMIDTWTIEEMRQNKALMVAFQALGVAYDSLDLAETSSEGPVSQNWVDMDSVLTAEWKTRLEGRKP
jgi:hypothetical protein